MAFVDITGTVDADTDGIVFEGKPGLERPIIPRFVVPKDIARKLSKLTIGDAESIERQRRAGNTSIQFDESQLRSLIADLGDDPESLGRVEDKQPLLEDGLRYEPPSGPPGDRLSPSPLQVPITETLNEAVRRRRSRNLPGGMRSAREAQDDEYYGPDPDEPPIFDEPEQFDGMWTPGDDQLRDLDQRLGREPQEEEDGPPDIGKKYRILQSEDGIYYADGITARDVRWLRSGKSKPPKLPFFAPKGGGNDQDTGEGYFFSITGKKYWGKYGGAGALVRRKNRRGQYEYFLARRSRSLSSSGGKWAFPGGAHKDRDSAGIPSLTAIEEFGEEVGGDLSNLQPITRYKDQVAPDWSYDTYVYEVGPKDLRKLQATTGETSKVGWFTEREIKKLAKRGKLHSSFSRAVDEIIDKANRSSRSSRSSRSDDLSSLDDAALRSSLAANSDRLKKLDDQLDSGEIELPDYRKQQASLRKESSRLNAELRRRSGEEPQRQPEAPTPRQPKRESIIERGDGMIKRDDKGRPIEWNTEKFLAEQNEKRINWLRSLGFSDDEIRTLTGSDPSAQVSSRSSRSKSLRLDAFDLFTTPITASPDTRPFDGIDSWSDDELKNVLDVFNIEMPRQDGSQPLNIVPDWLPTQDQVALELERRGYSIFLAPGSSRRHQDFKLLVANNPNADDSFTDRRIAKPSGQLTKLIRDKQKNSDKPILAASIKDWDFIELVSSLSDDDLAALSLDFDKQRRDKIKERQDGVISSKEFDGWYSELTRLRRLTSDEMTKRSLRAMAKGKKQLTPNNDDVMSLADYTFIKQGMPSLKSKRSFGLVVDSLIEDGRVNQDTFNELLRYHDAKDYQLNQLGDAFESALSTNIFDPGFSIEELGTNDKEIALDIFNKYDLELSKQLGSLDLQTFSRDELASIGIDEDDIDDILEGPIRGVSLSSRSKRDRKKNKAKPVMRPNKKLGPEELRISQEQKLRAKKIPGKKKSGPNISEWKESRPIGHTASSARRSSNIAMLNDVALGKNPSLIGQVAEIDNSVKRISFGSDVRAGDILPGNFSDRLRAQGGPRFQVVSVGSSNNNSRSLLLRDLNTGDYIPSVVHDAQSLSDVIRPKGKVSSSRSSRIGIPQVRNKVIRLHESGDDDGIVDYVDDLVRQLRNVQDQIALLDQQAGPDGLSDDDDKRWTQLEEMSSGIERELSEIISTIDFIGVQANDKAFSASAIQEALKQLRNNGSYIMGRVGLDDDDQKLVELMLKEQQKELKQLSLASKPGRISALADEVSKSIARESLLEEITFEEIDFDDEEVAKKRDRLASELIEYATGSILRARELDSATRTVINTTAREVDSSAILALPPSSASGRSSRPKGNVPVLATGEGLPLSRRLHPSPSSKFTDSEFSSIVFDGNSGEIIVRRKNGDVSRFGGIDNQLLANFLDKRKSPTASLNELDKSARYLVRPNGDVRGSKPPIGSLLERDIARIDLSGNDKSLVDGVIDSLTNEQSINSIRTEDLHDLISRLHGRGESAFANNLLNAIAASSTNRAVRNEIAPLYSRQYASPSKPIKVILSADEVAEMREEVGDLQQQFGFNPRIKEGLDVYSNALSKAQNDSSIQEIILSPEEYEKVAASYTFIADMPKPEGRKAIGLQPLEIAASSPRFEFNRPDSGLEPLSRKRGPLNDGAPLDFDISRKNEITTWLENTRSNSVVSQLLEDERTLNWWRSAEALKAFWPTVSQRSVRGANAVEAVDASMGASLSSMKPSNYREMPPIDKLVWLNDNIASPSNKKGIRRTEANQEAQIVTNSLSIAADNIDKLRDYNTFVSSAPENDASDLLPQHLANWMQLSRSSRETLNADAEKLYGQEYAELNLAQAANILRRVRSGATGRSNSIASIDDSDTELLLGPVVRAVDDFTAAIKRRQRNNAPNIDLDLPRSERSTNVRNPRQSIQRRGFNLSRVEEQTYPAPQTQGRAQRSAPPKSASESRERRIMDSRRLSRVADMSASDIDEAFGSRYENPRFTDAFKKIQGIFSDGSRQGAGGSGEFSLGDLDVAIDIADELLYSNEALDAINGNWDLFGQRLSPSAQSSILDAIGRMRAIRKEMAKLRDQYESDPFIRQSPSRVVPMARPSEPARPARRQQLQNINPIDEVEKYLSARYSSPISARSGRTDNSSAKEGRAEIRAEATKFKELLDSLDIEINKASDPQLSRALTKLKETIRRQKSALLSDKRTNAGALFLTQAELDDIIEALYMALDRQVERGSETRSRLFADFAELMARAAMATFVDKTIEPINSRKVTRLNEAGEEVEIVLYE